MRVEQLETFHLGRSLKGRFPAGPADGLAGMRANEDHVRVMREAAGPGVDEIGRAHV